MAESLSRGGQWGRAAGQLFNAARRAAQHPHVRHAAQAAGQTLAASVVSPEAGRKVSAGRRLARQCAAHLALGLRQLGYQIGGILFLLFALAFGWHGFTLARHLPSAANARMAYVQMAIGLLFAYFGVSSWFKSAALRRRVK
jgi:hypothetical protein